MDYTVKTIDKLRRTGAFIQGLVELAQRKIPAGVDEKTKERFERTFVQADDRGLIRSVSDLLGRGYSFFRQGFPFLPDHSVQVIMRGTDPLLPETRELYSFNRSFGYNTARGKELAGEEEPRPETAVLNVLETGEVFRYSFPELVEYDEAQRAFDRTDGNGLPNWFRAYERLNRARKKLGLPEAVLVGDA